MIRSSVFILFVLFIFKLSFAQENDLYNTKIYKADSLYKANNFRDSAITYESAFSIPEAKIEPNERYNAACSYALANDIDNAFRHLFELAESPSIKYRNYWHIATDLDLDNLHDQEKWNTLLTIVKANKDAYEGITNKDLTAVLDSIMIIDQRGRREYRQVIEDFGFDSEEVKEKGKAVFKSDSLNVIKVKRILNEHGWLGPEVVGRSGTNALFITLQHATLEDQLTYLPMVRNAVKEGKLQGGALALLEDRVSLRQGNKQIYGSQTARDPDTGDYYVMPLIDPDNVNKRRAEVGLGPIEESVKRYGIVWDVEAHKSRIKELESKKEK